MIGSQLYFPFALPPTRRALLVFEELYLASPKIGRKAALSGAARSWHESPSGGDQRIAQSMNLTIHLDRIRNRAAYLLA
jgi:hypothetical protein